MSKIFATFKEFYDDYNTKNRQAIEEEIKEQLKEDNLKEFLARELEYSNEARARYKVICEVHYCITKDAKVEKTTNSQRKEYYQKNREHKLAYQKDLYYKRKEQLKQLQNQ